MKKYLFALGLCFLPSIAFAQNVTCATRPAGDNSNACASTAFVDTAITTNLPLIFTATTAGLVPASGGGTTNFLRADGTFAPTPAATPIANLTISANYTGASALPQGYTLSTILDNVFGTTRGSIIERGASVWQIITPGAIGTFLGGQGVGADPVYLTPPNAPRSNVRQTVQGGPTQNIGNVTISIATPGVVTFANQLLQPGTPVVFSTTGALPTGLIAGTVYFVSATGGPAVGSFDVSTTLANAFAGTNIATSGTQSGTQTITASMSGPSFLASAYPTLTVTAQNVGTGANALTVSSANGFNGTGLLDVVTQVTTAPSWTLTANAVNYLMIDAATGATSTKTVTPVDQNGGTIGVTSGLLTFDYSQYLNYLGTGTTAAASTLVKVGECTAGASSVTGCGAYVYGRHYDSGWINTLPASVTVVTKPSNMGTTVFSSRIQIKNLVSEQGYNVGDIGENIQNAVQSGFIVSFALVNRRTTTAFTTGTLSPPWYYTNATSGALVTLTTADWAYRVLSQGDY